MQRTYKRLSRSRVNMLVKARTPGAYADGDGLYLMISRAGVPSRAFRFMINGRAREMGLGPTRDIGLARARELAYDARQLKRAGIDPVEDRRAKKQGVAVARAKTMSFEACARAYITAKQADWKSAQNRAQWVRSLETYVAPLIGKLPVASIDTDLVMQVLQPIWNDKPETASRLRNRIENILDWARTSGHRSGDNPARWKGHLQNLLSSHKEVRVEHFPALPYREVPGFMRELRAQRPGVFDPHRGALQRGAQGDLGRVRDRPRVGDPGGADEAEQGTPRTLGGCRAGDHRQDAGDPLQPVRLSWRFGGALGHNALGQVLQRLKRSDVTPHGFRSSFRDWVAQETSFDDKVAEMALAHTIGSVVEASYRRGDLFAKRRALAEAWAAYCVGGAEVIDIRAGVRSA